MGIKECCKKPENLGPPQASAPHETMRRCKVCNCRHFRLTVEPGMYVAKLSQLGGGKDA
ncbi:hypothetical protein LCGC14_2917660 [marine sediment metagenome]|uniref:Uncharacterized protein n=1 Tax=marine sediment metagenome TaxID=412755 RepID=A0A0F8ZXA0_9ZZZZ